MVGIRLINGRPKFSMKTHVLQPYTITIEETKIKTSIIPNTSNMPTHLYTLT